ncbi:unnamed protein product [Caenorhabditis bovis]|uniref:Uncharacterized protein n=1 Tax=Caenorhabditis bovis TaxID=2654633 RepID=A0A8S1EKT9_9PELO|nr:unnamed protein product [Caenorhabditis bovis]
MMRHRSTCWNVTEEGERLFRMHKYEKGIDLLKKALEVGTDDFSLLSAIYCQLGNAHIMLKDYENALKYHTYDMLVEKLVGNKGGEAKSCANLGNVFKMKGAYNDALTFTFKQLELSEQLGNMQMKGRACYNVATIFVERGRYLMLESTEQQDPEKEIEARSDFENAIKYYNINLEYALSVNDCYTMGRCYGSLGNVYYCLADYDEAIKYHTLRLDLARQFGVRDCTRRAHANLANCYALKSNMQAAIQHYKSAYRVAYELGNDAEEAQMAYSLANSLYIDKEIPEAISYFFRHLDIARKLNDKPGQMRSYFSLALCFQSLKDLRKSLYFLILSKRFALQLGDTSIISDIDNLLKEILEAGKSSVLLEDCELLVDPSADPLGPQVEHSETFLAFFKKRSLNDKSRAPKEALQEERHEKEEFLDMLQRVQSKRMNDQRADISVLGTCSGKIRQRDTEPDNSSTDGSEVLIDLLLNAQARRMDDQRAPFLPGLNENGQLILRRMNSNPVEELDSNLIDWLMRVQSQRLDEQRSELPEKVREEDVTDIVLRMQAGRLEDQRAHLPASPSSSSSNH